MHTSPKFQGIDYEGKGGYSSQNWKEDGTILFKLLKKPYNEYPRWGMYAWIIF